MRRRGNSDVGNETLEQRAKSRVKIITGVGRRRERGKAMRSERSKVISKNNSF